MIRDVRLDHAAEMVVRRARGPGRDSLEEALARPYAQAVAAGLAALEAEVERANAGRGVALDGQLVAEVLAAAQATGGTVTPERACRDVLGLRPRGAMCVMRALARAGLAEQTRTRRGVDAWTVGRVGEEQAAATPGRCPWCRGDMGPSKRSCGRPRCARRTTATARRRKGGEA